MVGSFFLKSVSVDHALTKGNQIENNLCEVMNRKPTLRIMYKKELNLNHRLRKLGRET